MFSDYSTALQALKIPAVAALPQSCEQNLDSWQSACTYWLQQPIDKCFPFETFPAGLQAVNEKASREASRETQPFCICTHFILLHTYIHALCPASLLCSQIYHTFLPLLLAQCMLCAFLPPFAPTCTMFFPFSSTQCTLLSLLLLSLGHSAAPPSTCMQLHWASQGLLHPLWHFCFP